MTNEKKRMVPELRFRGFTDDWEQRKLRSALSFLKDGTHGSHPDGDFAYLLSTKNLQSGMVVIDPKTDRKIDEQNYKSIFTGYTMQDNDVLMSVVGRIGSVAMFKLNPSRHVAFQRSVAILRGKDGLTQEFLFHELQTYPNQRQFSRLTTKSAQPDLFLGDLGNAKISFPDITEQIQIATFINIVDNAIALHQRKHEALLKLKEAYLQKLFPEKDNKYPVLRFAGFTDDWEQRKFKMLYQKVIEKNDLTLPKEKVISVAQMQWGRVPKNSTNEYMRSYNVFRVGDIAFEGNRSKNFAFGRFVENTIGSGLVSHVFDVYRPIEPLDLAFWKYYIHDEGVMRDILRRSTQKSTMMTNLISKDFLRQKILTPALKEQHKIGYFLSMIDSTIALHQRKLEKLQELKKGYLQKMFC
jgi:type I restriction enzyme S subunit